MAEDLFLNNGWINSYLLWLIFPCFFFVCFFLTLLTVKVTVLIKKKMLCGLMQHMLLLKFHSSLSCKT